MSGPAPPPPPPGTPPPMPSPPGWSPPPPAAAGGSKMLLVAVVVVVVVVAAVLAALVVAGVGPFARSGSSGGSNGGSGGAAQSFSTAASQTSSKAQGQSGGPWTLFGGFGFYAGVAATFQPTLFGNLTSGTIGSACTLTLAAGAPSSVSVSAGGTYSDGTPPVWVVEYVGGSGLMLIGNNGGNAFVIGTVSGGSICSLIGTAAAKLPSSYLDSPAIAARAAGVGGASFQTAHAKASMSMSLSAGFTYLGFTTPAIWSVTFTNCDPSGTNSTTDGMAPAEFLASFDAVTGHLKSAQNTTAACSGGSGNGGGTSGSLASGLWLTRVGETNPSSSAFWNNVSVVAANKTISLDDLTFSVVNATSHVAVSTTGFTFGLYNFLNSTPIATYSFATATWSSGGTHDLAYLDSFALFSPGSLAGDELKVTAGSSAPVTGSTYLQLGP